ncbi:hypothetical protein ACHAXS_014377 [Conticribra weissflogii]
MLMENGSPRACTLIGWNDAYWWCCNLWMAFAVFYQLHNMLVAAKQARRHYPPSLRRIIIESICIHSFSALMASLTLVPLDWIPRATATTGCEPFPDMEHTGQLIFYWSFFLPMTSLIPTILVTGFAIDVWRRKLLPVNGKTRELIFYFARLLAVIYMVTIAVIISFFFHSWVQAIAFVAFNLTGFFQVCLALFKKDVRRAWIRMWKCQNTVDDKVPSSSDGESVHNLDSMVLFALLRNSWFGRLSSLVRISSAAITMRDVSSNGKKKAMAKVSFHRDSVMRNDGQAHTEGVEKGDIRVSGANFLVDKEVTNNGSTIKKVRVEENHFKDDDATNGGAINDEKQNIEHSNSNDHAGLSDQYDVELGVYGKNG